MKLRRISLVKVGSHYGQAPGQQVSVTRPCHYYRSSNVLTIIPAIYSGWTGTACLRDTWLEHSSCLHLLWVVWDLVTSGILRLNPVHILEHSISVCKTMEQGARRPNDGQRNTWEHGFQGIQIPPSVKYGSHAEERLRIWKNTLVQNWK